MKTDSTTKSSEYPQKVRASSGTAITIGLTDGNLQTSPNTAYLMTYNPNKCLANCSFCPQARDSCSSDNMLSRISWPVFRTKAVIEAITKSFRDSKIKRVCIQALNYPEVFNDVASIITATLHQCKVPISVSCQPSKISDLRRLREAGTQRIGIPIDAATEGIFEGVKGKNVGGPYRWKKQFQMLKESLRVFGKENVSTHLIVGLGETEEEMVQMLQECVDIGILPALFAFTPIKGTKMQDRKPPQIQVYRRIQIAEYLIMSKAIKFQNMRFVHGRIVDFGVSENVLRRIACEGEAFRTSGCPDCNRPYYNERPTGPLYNYPLKPKPAELSEIRKQIGLV